MKKIIFVDYTSSYTHINVKNRSIGASEYQLYNLIETLSKYVNIYCFNHLGYVKIDNVIYDNFTKLINFEIDENDVIVFQRFLPYDKLLLNKISKNKKILWIHDIAGFSIFMRNDHTEIKKHSHETLKNNILLPIQDDSTFQFICNSNNCKNLFDKFLSGFNIKMNDERIFIIYNILYDFELIVDKSIKPDKNNIVYASAWGKGVEKVVELFDYIYKKNNNIKLTLLSPGYDYNHYQGYINTLKNKYGDQINILGPINKIEYSKVMRSTCCVFSPSFNETFGCVFSESYHFGTPVIADKMSGAVCEIIGTNNIVNYNNSEEVYNKFIEIQKNRDDLNIQLDEKFYLKNNIVKWCKLLEIDNIE
jgi:glycosyltransferase involved in cell wall biosynthesis